MTITKIHPQDAELAGYLDLSLSSEDRQSIESHISRCDECLAKVVSAYESVKNTKKAGKANMIKKLNIYLVLAIVTFTLSFVMPRYFLQFLSATLLLGTKWIVDAKTTKMLITICEAWKSGNKNEASRIIETINSHKNNRF